MVVGVMVVGVAILVWRFTTTGQALRMRSAPNSLRRIIDEIVEVPSLIGRDKPDPAHIRVWRGWVGWRHRTVVVLGVTDGGMVPPAYIGWWAAWLNHHVLHGLGHRAVWITIRPRTRYEEPRFVNEVFRRYRRRSDGSWPHLRSEYLDAVIDVDRLIGVPLEQFPGDFYRRDIVEEWQRTGKEVAVVDDSFHVRRNGDALTVLDEHRHRWPTQTALAGRVVASLMLESDGYQTRIDVRDQNPNSTWLMRVDDPLAPDLNTTHLAVIATPARLTAADQDLLGNYAERIEDESVTAALDVLMPWEQHLRRMNIAERLDSKVVDAVKIAVDGLQGRARVIADASPDPRKLTVWRYKLWWIARRTDLPWLTDPDDGCKPRYTENTLDWTQIAAAVNTIASQLDRDDLVPYYDDTVTVDCDLTELGEEERGIVYSWFNGCIAPNTDRWFHSMVDGRHRVFGIWQADPSARIPIVSPTLLGAVESGLRLNDRDLKALRDGIARLDTSSGANRRFARLIEWALQGNAMGLDHRGGPPDRIDKPELPEP